MESGSSVESGIAKAIDGSSVQKVIEKNQKKYVRLEKKMFKIVKAWESFRGRSTFTEEDDLQIVFQKPKIMVSDRETLENIKVMRELGLIEEWEKFVIMDPNLSEEEARAKLDRIELKKLENVQTFLGEEDASEQESVDEESEAGLE